MEELEEALNFERTENSAEEYFTKVRKLAEKLAKYKWSVGEIERCPLIHGSRDINVKKEIKFREVKKITLKISLKRWTKSGEWKNQCM